jgi:hypothetical protein
MLSLGSEFPMARHISSSGPRTSVVAQMSALHCEAAHVTTDDK